jgi:hypothetical protein
MVKYCDGKIYMIAPITGGEIGDVYIGSTTRKLLSQRMMGHRADYKGWKNGVKRKTTSYDIFSKYGVENCQITLLEQVNATCKDELYARERHHIESLACVNRCIVGRSRKEYNEDNRGKIAEYKAKYREKNQEQISEYNVKYQAKYGEQNQEQISKNQAEYYQANREKKVLQQREYYARKKQQLEAESNT